METTEHNLDKDLSTNPKDYFFTLLTNRFDIMNDRFKEILENKFNKSFEPIYIFTGTPNKYYEKNNYIILNKELPKYQRICRNNKVIFNPEFEDMNKEFSESTFIKKTLKQLSEKQENIFVFSFTNSFFNIKNPKVKFLGPSPKLATKLDSKIEHIKIFRKLKINHNKTIIFHSFKKVRRKSNALFPFFISATFSSGSGESGLMYNGSDLNKFFGELRNHNKNNSFLVAPLLKFKAAPNVNAFIDNGSKVKVLVITDQLLHDNAYVGNIYPSKISQKSLNQIKKDTVKIGKYLAKKGYRGLFGLDFLVDKKDKAFTVDLNPRKQGGYLCNYLMSTKSDILLSELEQTLGEKITRLNEKDFKVNYSWGHSKIKPHYGKYDIKDYRKIVKEIKSGLEREVFRSGECEFASSFFPKNYLLTGGTLGYYIVSGKNRQAVENKVIEKPEELLKELLK